MNTTVEDKAFNLRQLQHQTYAIKAKKNPDQERIEKHFET